MKIPFDKSELTDAVVYGAGGRRPVVRFRTPISPRENWRRVWRGEKPEWLPLRSDIQIFTPRCIPDNIARGFLFDGGAPMSQVGGKDMMGVDWVYEPQVGGSMVLPGKPMLEDVNDWKQVLTFPDVDSWDWAGSAAISKAYLDTDRVVESWYFTGYFERLISLMDFENAALALIDEDQEEALHEFFQALTQLHIRVIGKMKQHFPIDMICFHDDWGGQRGPFFSLETCRRMLVPYLKQVVDFCHENDIIFNFHSCGKNELLVPAMVEFGADMWGGQAINDQQKLYAQYGDKLMLGLNAQPGEKDKETFAREFVDTYWPALREKPIFLMDNFADPQLRALIYEYSRRAQ